MLLLSGPPGSGRTSHILGEFRQSLRRNATDIRLLAPTATMAGHLRHLLAREGFVLRPNLILTLSQFVAPWVEDLPQISPPALYLLVEQAARRLAPPEFARVLRTPGFCAALAQTMEEFSAAGCDSRRLEQSLPRALFGEPFVAVYKEVEREMERRGLGLRSDRLERAARRIAQQGLPGVRTVWMDGFFAFSDPELAVIRALAGHTELTVTLPELDGPNFTRDALLAMGFAERRLERRRAQPVVQAFSTPTVDREAEEIARRILAQVEAGREFREIGIIVRNPEVYLPPLRAALERFGIPARFYSSDPLNEHGTVRYMAGVVTALLSGWDHAKTLGALRYYGDSPALDQFDFAVRQQLPGSGLDSLKALTDDHGVQRLLGDVAALEALRPLALTPAQWASRLARAIRPPKIADLSAKPLLWRSHASARAAFETALAEAAGCLEETRRIRLDEFWTAAEAVLRLSTLRVAGHRRNVTHVLSVFEARQWELPVVFICGMAEQQFPKRHAQDPLFPDPARQRLAQSGIRVRTAAELEREERFLYELASTRATSALTMSYAETDTRGVRNVQSQFLSQPAARCGLSARPRQARGPAADPGGRPTINHRSFSPSGLECFLDCPFQFFARYTLKLRGRPLLPQERLDFMLQGTIIHQALSEWHRSPQPIEPLFDRVFAERCEKAAVFMGYRTEFLRRQMVDDLLRFSENQKLPVCPEILTEQPFEMELGDSLLIRGRIDRIDLLPDGRALIVDYKYSAAARVAEKLEKTTLLQGGLYALAVERTLGLKPAAVFYYGLKKDLRVAGWSDPPGAFRISSQPLTRQWIDAAVDRARGAVEQIRSGRIAPEPASLDLCRLCDYRDVCRFEGAAKILVADGK
jgi:ATP-dependent helicase/DNAse subunit B